MTCPDEDTYAGFLQGLLPPERVAAIEQHIDGCPRCAELSAEFGKLYSADGPAANADPPANAPVGVAVGVNVIRPGQSSPTPTPTPTGLTAPAELTMVEVAMAAIHAAWTIVALPAALRAWMAVASPGGGGTTPGRIALAAAAYVIAWSPAGGALALAAALGLWRRRSWARRVRWLHALLSLPSVVLTPLAAYALYRLRRPLESN
jgi:anti-sigma factor RsiW